MPESLSDYEENPTPGNLEFYLVVSALRSQFQKAKDEQQTMPSYAMFTIVGSGEDAYARIRIADDSLASESLDLVSRDNERAIDVALPIKRVDGDNPELAVGERSGSFLLYDRSADSPAHRISAENIQDFIAEHPDFVSKSLAYEPIPIKKSHVA